MDGIEARSSQGNAQKRRGYRNTRKIFANFLRFLIVLSVILAASPSTYSDVSAEGMYYHLFIPLLARESSNQGGATTDLLVPASATWKYLDNGTNQGTAWRAPDFHDSSWRSGPAELGYGDTDEKTILSYGADPTHKYVTSYFRDYFTVSDLAQISSLTLNLKRDDGAIVYLNGAEIFRSNMPAGDVTFQTYAKSSSDQTVSANVDPGSLVQGTNVIAVEIHQASPSSSDISFKLELIANLVTVPIVTPTPTSVVPTVQPTLPPTVGNNWYVAIDGSASNSGSIDSPWSIDYVFSAPSSIQPGDTIWLRGGMYGSGGDNPYNSQLEGSADKSITVRAYPGEHVIINGGIFIWKSYTIFWGLEILNTSGIRISAEGGSQPTDIAMSDGFGVYASHTKLINNVIHDTSGIGAWERATDVEIYGNLVYNSGWEGPDRGHGHGMYMQNEVGTKSIIDNIIFNNFSDYNVHIYTESAHIQGFILQGNVSFNGRLLVGGLQSAASITLDHNYFFNGEVQLGYDADIVNHGLSFTNNVLAGDNGNDLMDIKQWDAIDNSGNTFQTANGKAVVYENTYNAGQYSWNHNSYDVNRDSFVIGGSGKSWDSWRSATGFDANSSYNNDQPSGTQVFVRPNQYETKRANVIVYNWARQNSVLVDLSGTGLEQGDTYVIHNGENWNEIITGTYDGSSISIPMTGWTIAKPAGYSSALSPSTFPYFGVFVIDVK